MKDRLHDSDLPGTPETAGVLDHCEDVRLTTVDGHHPTFSQTLACLTVMPTDGLPINLPPVLHFNHN